MRQPLKLLRERRAPRQLEASVFNTRFFRCFEHVDAARILRPEILNGKGLLCRRLGAVGVHRRLRAHGSRCNAKQCERDK